MMKASLNKIPFGSLVVAAACLLSISSASAGSLTQTTSQWNIGTVPSPDLVTPADTFNICIVGFNSSNAGAFLVLPLTATFGLTQTFPGAGLGGQTVTVTSSESVGPTMTTDTITISVPTNFDPTGTTIGGLPVTTLEMDMGGYNAGTNTLDFTLPLTSPTYTGSLLYSGGTLALNPTPNSVLSNGNMSLATAEGVNAGGSDLAPFAIRSFTFNVSYASVPEPTSFVLFAIGGLGLLVMVQRRRHLS
ncbi:MAG: PEP-CTERM sorting domain-containing protein [Chthoniobacterales bacterium]